MHAARRAARRRAGPFVRQHHQQRPEGNRRDDHHQPRGEPPAMRPQRFAAHPEQPAHAHREAEREEIGVEAEVGCKHRGVHEYRRQRAQRHSRHRMPGAMRGHRVAERRNDCEGKHPQTRAQRQAAHGNFEALARDVAAGQMQLERTIEKRCARQVHDHQEKHHPAKERRQQGHAARRVGRDRAERRSDESGAQHQREVAPCHPGRARVGARLTTHCHAIRVGFHPHAI